jgi:hypothetical protein
METSRRCVCADLYISAGFELSSSSFSSSSTTNSPKGTREQSVRGHEWEREGGRRTASLWRHPSGPSPETALQPEWMQVQSLAASTAMKGMASCGGLSAGARDMHTGESSDCAQRKREETNE